MFDSWFPESQDRLPLTWWKQHPIYLAAIIALASAASMIVYALLGGGIMQSWFAFSFPAAFQQWHLWTPLTYVLVNPPSLWTLLGCYLLWSFGEAVERHLGRRAFVRLLLVLLLASPLLITVLHVAGLRSMACAGMMQLEFGVFIAFAALYPHAKINIIILSFDAWVLAAVIVGINALQCLAARDWISLLLLAANVGAAYAYILFEKGELRLPAMAKPSFKAARPAKPARPAKAQGPTVDDILDKISHHGMHSLTPEERRILDKASEDMKRGRG